MKRKVKEVFIAKDGMEFTDRASCEEYEKKLDEEENLTTYWRVSTNPDLTEGRGHQMTYYFKVKSDKYLIEVKVRDYCHRRFGRELAFIQGVAPITNWEIHQVTIAGWANPVPNRVGDYVGDIECRTLRFDPEGERGLVEESAVKGDRTIRGQSRVW